MAVGPPGSEVVCQVATGHSYRIRSGAGDQVGAPDTRDGPHRCRERLGQHDGQVGAGGAQRVQQHLKACGGDREPVGIVQVQQVAGARSELVGQVLKGLLGVQGLHLAGVFRVLLQ